ncbi:MAG: hypothetical protein WD512_12770, partial [Candidatus Paceibacterota bacterium]
DLSPKARELVEHIKKEKRNKIQVEEGLNLEQSTEQVFYNNLIEELKTKTMDLESFRRICKVAGKPYRNVRIYVNEKLRDTNHKERVKDFLVHNNTNSKKEEVDFQFKG